MSIIDLVKSGLLKLFGIEEPCKCISIVKFETLDDQSVNVILRPKFRSDDKLAHSHHGPLQNENFKSRREFFAFLRKNHWRPTKKWGEWLKISDDILVIELIKPDRIGLIAYRVTQASFILYFFYGLLSCMGDNSCLSALPVDPWTVVIFVLILGWRFEDRLGKNSNQHWYIKDVAWEQKLYEHEGKYLPRREELIKFTTESNSTGTYKMELIHEGKGYALTHESKRELERLVEDWRSW